VIATPIAHLNRSREVLLVWPNPTTIVESTANIPVEELVDDPDVTDGTEEKNTGDSDPVTDPAADTQ
jgi:hypothetical protein